ncbi:Xaa-pro aminopeptidase [Plakobranchus ocellatus]|uniref:Xaa-pro aminopeptidase n=1 Tax=Plakobranchus ocellatus TaxID=259542 RepID=A0AAV4AW38_9GAST|nr:Xaa-pro aminopeptidase [Plakobranchus ocellatus]
MMSTRSYRLIWSRLLCHSHVKTKLRKKNSVLLAFSNVRYFRQPAAETHPHLISVGEVTPGLTVKEFYNRRCNLVRSALKAFQGVKSTEHHLFVFPSATTAYMSTDIPYVFRQNTDFLYLCGFQEPDSLLLIKAHSSSLQTGEHEAILFVLKKDPEKELWHGPVSGADGAAVLTGVDAAFNSNEVEKYLHYYIKNHKNYVLWYNHTQPVHADFNNRVVSQLMKDPRHKYLENTASLLHSLRVHKSTAELRLMQKSVDIAAEAFVDVMKFSKPMINESQLWAKMDFECRMRGAEFLAYPPVVAGGNRANTIHYITNNQVVLDGEMVLMDAGCELHGYASDLTRTWPVSGQFTKAQKQLYNATLRVQEECIKMCTKAYSLDEIYTKMLHLLGEELLLLGIISAHTPPPQQLNILRKICPHHVSHYLGMDVHDTSTISRGIKLQPNMVVTIEPGIYIPADDFSVAPEYRGIGIRIEDNILVSESEPVNLSASCPKQAEEIEDLLSSR